MSKIIENRIRDLKKISESIVNSSLAEGRALSDTEQTRIKAINEEIRTLEKTPTRQVDRFDPASGIQVGDDRASKRPFKSVGEQFRAIAAAMTPGGIVDPRLHEINQRAASGLSEGIPSDGGFLVQTDFGDGIMQTVWENPLLEKIQRYEISGNSNSMTLNGVDETSRATGSRTGGLRAYWTAEAGEITSSKPSFREINLKLNKLAALVYVTEEMLEDSAVLGSFIESAASREIQFMLLDAIINGDGAGKPLGILNSACRVAQAKEGSQAADTIVYE